MSRCFHTIAAGDRSIAVCLSELVTTAAKSHQRFCCDERGARDGLHCIPQQPSAAAVGQRCLPVSETSWQLDQRSHPAVRFHPKLDQEWTSKVFLDLRILLSSRQMDFIDVLFAASGLYLAHHEGVSKLHLVTCHR